MPNIVLSEDFESDSLPVAWTAVGDPFIKRGWAYRGYRSLGAGLTITGANNAITQTLEAGHTQSVQRFYVRRRSTPATVQMPVFECRAVTGKNFQIRVSTTGNLQGFITGASVQTYGAMIVDRTYRVDVSIDVSGATIFMDWQVAVEDPTTGKFGAPVAQTRVQLADSASTLLQVRLGSQSLTDRVEVYIDDWALSWTPADYPLGDSYAGSVNLPHSPSGWSAWTHGQDGVSRFDALEQPDCVRIWYTWAEIEPTDNPASLSWATGLDNTFKAAIDRNKKVFLAIEMGKPSPSWIYSPNSLGAGVRSVQVYTDSDPANPGFLVPFPTDPVYQQLVWRIYGRIADKLRTVYNGTPYYAVCEALALSMAGSKNGGTEMTNESQDARSETNWDAAQVAAGYASGLPARRALFLDAWKADVLSSLRYFPECYRTIATGPVFLDGRQLEKDLSTYLAANLSLQERDRILVGPTNMRIKSPESTTYKAHASSGDSALLHHISKGMKIWVQSDTQTIYNLPYDIGIQAAFRKAMLDEGLTKYGARILESNPTTYGPTFTNNREWVRDTAKAAIAAVWGAAVAPVNSVLPLITGSAIEGASLSCSTGTWSNSPISFSYQWWTDTGGVQASISGATASVYVPVAADVGKQLFCVVTATNAAGEGTATTTLTAAVTAAGATLPANTLAPAVTGTLTVGSTLSTTDGTWTNAVSFTYKWMSRPAGGGGFSVIAGATASTFVLTSTQLTQSILCKVTATNANGSTEKNSNIVGPIVDAGVPAISVAPVASGQSVEGVIVSCTNGSWTNSPTSFSYQWQKDTVNISGATEAEYLVRFSDVGGVLRCQVTAHNAAGDSVAANSNNLSVIVAVIAVPAGGRASSAFGSLFGSGVDEF